MKEGIEQQLGMGMRYEEVRKQLKGLEEESSRVREIYEDERDEKKLVDRIVTLESYLSNLKGRLESTNFQLHQCTTSSRTRKRMRAEDEYPKSNNPKKIGIFIHVVGGNCAHSHKYNIASTLYKIEMDSDRYRNPSPPYMSFQDLCFNAEHCFTKIKHKSKPHPIKPVFDFTFDHGYPIGMACVLFKQHHLYLMGGSITYKFFFNKSMLRPHSLYEKLNTTDPNMYPPNVYVFDCFTCRLLPPPPPMNSGKSAHPFTFVYNNKLYVLSSTIVPKELHMFEVFDPHSLSWTILNNPPYDCRDLDNPLGSVLIDGVFFISYKDRHQLDTPVHIFSYNIASKKWNTRLSVFRPLNRGLAIVPSFERDSVFVQNKLYSANVWPLFQDSRFEFPILSYGPIPTTAKLDAYAFDSLAIPNLTPIFPLDACWPIYEWDKQGIPHARLVHLGGLLDGTNIDTTCFGFVQVLDPVEDGSRCYIRFVAFEAFTDEVTCDSDTYIDASKSMFQLPAKCGPFFKAKTLEPSHFYSSGEFDSCRLNAACALILF